MSPTLQLLHHLILHLIKILQPYLGPICFLLAWTTVGLGLWQILVTVRESWQRAQLMHQIPCAECRFFTHTHQLKCPIHPLQALTEQAIGCRDFEEADPMKAVTARLKAQSLR